MYIFIKNMICVRCKMAVQNVLETLQIPFCNVELGRVEIPDSVTPEQLRQLNSGLKYFKLEILENKRKILVERIKNLLTDLIHSNSIVNPLKFTVYLSQVLGYDYTYLANVFSEEEGSTIERFFIVNRIERVKELIVYDDVSLKEITYQLNYSSVSHLCLQFKKVTGQTPSEFRKLCQSPDFVWKKCE